MQPHTQPLTHRHTCVLAGVKDAVVDAVEELYLKAATGGVADPRQAAQNLVALAQDSSLGQSSTLKPVCGAHLLPAVCATG